MSTLMKFDPLRVIESFTACITEEEMLCELILGETATFVSCHTCRFSGNKCAAFYRIT